MVTISKQAQMEHHRRKVADYRMAQCCETCMYLATSEIVKKFRCNFLDMDVSPTCICDRYRKHI